MPGAGSAVAGAGLVSVSGLGPLPPLGGAVWARLAGLAVAVVAKPLSACVVCEGKGLRQRRAGQGRAGQWFGQQQGRQYSFECGALVLVGLLHGA